MTATAPAAPAWGNLRAWGLAARHRTLVAAVVPIAVGSGVAWHDGAFNLPAVLAALVAALLIQIGTNLANDYHDHRRGADTSERLGPPRVTSLGLIQPNVVLTGALACFAAAVLVGVYLVMLGGWPILLIGIASVIAGYCYTGGPFPLAYHGLGEVFVMVFFGIIAVTGTYYLHTLHWSPVATLAGIAVGALAIGLLTVNNVRDEPTDRRANKRTLVVRFGPRFGRAEYVAALAVGFAVPVAVYLARGLGAPWVLAPELTLPVALGPMALVLKERGATLNRALAGTAKLQLLFGFLFAIGLAL